MTRLGAVIAQAIVHEYGRDELLRRLAFPFWFQSFGAVMGMDWHSSGITTSVIGALKRGLEPLAGELGLRVCGGRGRHSRRTPAELIAAGDRAGFDGAALARVSRLVAKVDSAALQDGFDLYLHGFIVADDGKWTVVQQGMNGDSRRARRYHWLSEGLQSFVDAPHAAILGQAQGNIINLADPRAAPSRNAQLTLLTDLSPGKLAREAAALQSSLSRRWSGRHVPRTWLHNAGHCAPDHGEGDRAKRGGGASSSQAQIENTCPLLPHLNLPDHHDVTAEDVILRRLHGTLAAAAEAGPADFPDLLLVPGVGARTIRSLAMVAEVIHGAPCRFADPARFSLAHGGKDRHPFPVPTKVYDKTIGLLKKAVANAKLGNDEKLAAIRRLDEQARRLERHATGPSLDAFIAEERGRSHDYGGRSVFGWEPPASSNAATN
jgi:hypothetical protein